MKLSVIIPTYNEEKRLPKTLREIDKYLSNQGYDSEIFVVDGGSTDRTADVVREMTQEISNLKLIEAKESRGKGGAVKTGILKAEGEYRVFTDADNSTSIDHIEKMWPLFEKGYQVVIGSRDKRDVKGASQAVPQPFWKRFLGDVGNIIIQIVAVWGVWDTQCGFKAFKKEAAQNLFKRCKITGWAFDVEVLALAKKFGYKIGIVPVYWINDPESKVKLKAYFDTLLDVFRIKKDLILGRYD